MFIYYVKNALRNIIRLRLYSFINIVGLAIGLSATIGLGSYVYFQLSFDHYHSDSERIYRINYTNEKQGASYAKVPAPLADFLKGNYPQIEEITRIVPTEEMLVTHQENMFYENRILFADPSISKILNLPLAIGTLADLESPNSIYIRKGKVQKYFGDINPVGKTLLLNNETELIVKGILQDIPQNTHLPLDFLISMNSVESVFGKGYLDNKFNTIAYTYLKLHESKDQAASDLLRNAAKDYGAFEGTQFTLQPLRKIHLFSNLGGEFVPNGSIGHVYVMSVIAILILLIASINHMNLSSALYYKRLTEIGVRKVIGSSIRQLVHMSMAETFIIISLALLISIIGFQVFSSSLTMHFGNIFKSAISNPIMLLIVACLIGTITVLNGIYPIVLLTKRSIVSLLRSSPDNGKHHVKNFLMIVQFVVFIVLFISTVIIQDQVSFMKNKDLGFKKDALLVLPLVDKSIRNKLEPLKNELLGQSDVSSVSGSSDLPGRMQWITSISFEGRTESDPSTMAFLMVDSHFIDTYGLEILEGSNFAASNDKYIINETARKELNWDNPIGKQFSSSKGGNGRIVGVVKDFNTKPLHDKIDPLFLVVSNESQKYLSLRLNTKNLSETLMNLEKVWNKLLPESPFEYYFYDSFYDNLYRDEAHFSKIVRLFTVLALIISCFGLFGISTLSAEQRTREIGIRRVLGATIPEIVLLMSRDYFRWVLVGFIIAAPIAYLFIQKWLQNFAYQISIQLFVFLIAGTITMFVVIMTVSWQFIRAALINPAHTLKQQ